MPAFKFIKYGMNIPIGYQKIKLQMVFDVNMNFTHKSHLVTCGHMTDITSSMKYYVFLSQYSVRIILLMADLNYFDVIACNIRNCNFNAPCREKLWHITGP